MQKMEIYCTHGQPHSALIYGMEKKLFIIIIFGKSMYQID